MDETINAPAETKPGSAPQIPATPPVPTGGAERTFTQAEVDAILKERLDREQRKSKDAQERAQAQAADAAAKEQGKWRELAEQYEPQAKRAGDLDKFIGELLEAELKGIPERVKPVIPQFGDKLDTLRWVQAAKSAGLLAAPQAPNTDAREAARPGQTTMSEAEKREKAAQLGVDWRYMPG